MQFEKQDVKNLCIAKLHRKNIVYDPSDILNTQLYMGKCLNPVCNWTNKFCRPVPRTSFDIKPSFTVNNFVHLFAQ